MPKSPPDRLQDAWDMLAGVPSEEELDAEVDRIETLGDRDRGRELDEGGFDRREVAMSAQITRERLLRELDPAPLQGIHRDPEPQESPGPAAVSARERHPPSVRAVEAVPADAPRTARDPRRGALVTAAVVAAFVCAVGVAVMIARGRREPQVAQPSPSETASPPSPEPTVIAAQAANLRDRAAVACEARMWIECRDLLDRAAGVDPAGEGEPGVARLRRTIAGGLAPRQEEKPKSSR